MSEPKTIQPLSLDVIHRMAAGEVIDSISAVVRELVENAIDAKATRIVIYLWLDQWTIHVMDNGQGISYENLKTIALPHTTNKISQQSDLSNITTLGFRGEALHSIAQFSQLEILSCLDEDRLESNLESSRESTGESNDEPSGWLAKYNSDGEVETLEEAAIAPGTIIRVNQLFQNWETRRTGTPKQQLKSIQSSIQNIAVVHPEITLQIFQDDREWLTLGNTKNLAQRLLQVLPNGALSDFSMIQTPELELVLGLPDRISRRSPDWIRIAVNGRIVQIPELFQTMMTALRKTLPRDRYPIVLVHLHAPPYQVDWNRDPDKSSLYLQELESWQTLIIRSIQEALTLTNDLLSGQRTTQFLRAAEQSAGYGLDRAITPIAPITEPKPTRSLPGSLKAIAQVRNTYILAEHPAGMYLIEQHIAHERVLYEQICDRWHLVPMEPAIILTALSDRQVEQLEAIGLTVDDFGEQLWAVRTIPEMLLHRDDRAAAILELSLLGDLNAAQVSIACRTAIRNGTPLTPAEQRHLLQQWQQTRNPHTCPHGRPIYLVLQETALAQFFRRQWVIGKSHGLEAT
jgi:DNA mismatch repair protein MutL